MKHIKDILPVLLDGELTGPEEKAVRKHLAVCASCRQEMDGIRLRRRALQHWPKLWTPAHLRAMTLQKVHVQAGRAGVPVSVWDRVRTALMPVPRVVLAAACLMLVLLGGIIWKLDTAIGGGPVLVAAPEISKNKTVVAHRPSARKKTMNKKQTTRNEPERPQTILIK